MDGAVMSKYAAGVGTGLILAVAANNAVYYWLLHLHKKGWTTADGDQ
jgi:hypothetical protein